MERLKKQPNFYAREGEVKSTYYSNQPIILLVYKEVHFNINKFNLYTLSFCVSLLQKFDDVFFDEIPSRLPPIRGIEHQINLVSSALIHNRPAYQSKSQGNRKPSKKVEELMTNRYSFEMNEMSIILVLLTHK
jgi:hypothetical protein